MIFHGVRIVSSVANFPSEKMCGDLFRFLATTIVIFFVSTSPSFAAVDFSLGANLRSYPLSGVMEAESGYGILLYGSETAAPWYGYLRPRAVGASAATYNSADGALEFFPLSFLGARAGGESIQNDQDYSSYDCVAYVCLGRFYRTYFESEFALGAGPVFAKVVWRRERWTQKVPGSVAVIEPTSGIILDGMGDSETVYRGILGVRLSPMWTVLGIVRYAEGDGQKMVSRFPCAVVRYKVGEWSIGAGGGIFESTLKSKGGSAVAFLRWEPWPGIGLN